MNGLTIFGLMVTTLLPILLSFIFHLLIGKGYILGRLNFWVHQVIIGCFFVSAIDNRISSLSKKCFN